MRYVAVLALVGTLGLAAGCGDQGEPSSEEAGDEPTSATTPEPSEAATTETASLGDADVVPLTSEEICTALPVDAVSTALGTEVSQAQSAPAESTPQCAYTYGGDSSSLGTVTVAAQRPEDLGGRGLQEGYDYVLDLNRDLAAGTEVEEAEVAAGDRAVRLTGETLTLVVVAAAGHLLTIIATPDVETTAVEALATAAADAVA